MLDNFNAGDCTFWWDGVWADCCRIHDAAYAAGLNKFQADFDLGMCVAQSGHLGMGILMFLGVTIFGIFFYKKNRSSSTK